MRCGFGEVQPSCPGLSCITIQPMNLMPMVSLKELESRPGVTRLFLNETPASTPKSD